MKAGHEVASLAAIQRKLDRWELDHLRQHVRELSDRLERSELDLEAERASADYWRTECMAVIEDLQALGAQVGITQGGQIGVVA